MRPLKGDILAACTRVPDELQHTAGYVGGTLDMSDSVQESIKALHGLGGRLPKRVPEQ